MLTTSRRGVLRDDTREMFAPKYQAPAEVREETATEYNDEHIAQKLFGGDATDFEVRAVEKDRDDYENPDLMPSRQTMETIWDSKSFTTDKVILNARAKILIAGFVAVALALVLIITLTAVSVAGLFGDVSALETTLANRTAQIEQMREGLTTVDEAEMIKKAQGLGYQKPSSGQIEYFEKLPTRASQNYTVSSNWFDKICEFLSSSFGG